MFYIIDYDSRKVIFSGEKAEAESHYHEQALGEYAGLVGDEDDILLVFGDREMEDIYRNIKGSKPKYSSEEDLSQLVWSALESFTVKLEKEVKVVSHSELSNKVKRKTPSKPKEEKPKRTRKSKFEDMVFSVGEIEPPRGRHSKIVSFVEENLGEVSYGEIENFLIENGTAKPKPHINYAIKMGFIVENV